MPGESNQGPTGSGKECPQGSFCNVCISGLGTGPASPWRRRWVSRYLNLQGTSRLAVPSCATGPCCRQRHQPWHYKYWTKTFKSVEEGLSFFHCDRLAAEAHGVRRPPHPQNEASECKMRWMWRADFQGRKRPHEPRNPPWGSSSRSSVEISSLSLTDLTPREIAWRAELVNNLAAGTNKQRRGFSPRTLEVLQRDCLITQNTFSTAANLVRLPCGSRNTCFSESQMKPRKLMAVEESKRLLWSPMKYRSEIEMAQAINSAISVS